jgi:hypothetical protein
MGRRKRRGPPLPGLKKSVPFFVGDRETQDAVTATARAPGLAVVGPNCLKREWLKSYEPGDLPKDPAAGHPHTYARSYGVSRRPLAGCRATALSGQGRDELVTAEAASPQSSHMAQLCQRAPA